MNDVTNKLQELGVEPETITKITEELGAATIEQLASLTESDLIGIGMKKLPARDLAAKLASLVKPASSATTTVNTVAFDSILPTVPNDVTWLASLRAGGVSKVEESTVISAVRAALAHRAGLYSIPDILVKQMETFADTNEEQVDPEYFKLRKQLARRSYAEIFEGIDGLEGSYVTETRKKLLFSRIDEHLWPALVAFQKQLKSWQEAWLQGAANPAIVMSAILAASGGVGAMAPGLMQPPDTGTLRDQAGALADSINKVFSGTGVQITAALAYDASKIKETLENNRLPALIGAANREQMLRQLGVAVSATYPRLESNLTRFVLAVLRIKDQPAGNEELQYLSALFMLGSQIPWDQLGNMGTSGKVTGIGSGNRRESL